MRSRLIALLVVPTLTILVLAMMTVRAGDEKYQRAEERQSLATVARLLTALDGDLGEEALASAIFANMPHSDGYSDHELHPLFAPRFRTDSSLALLERQLDADGNFGAALRSALANTRDVTSYRTDIEQGLISPLQIADRYSYVRRQLLDALSLEVASRQAHGNEVGELIDLINVRSAHLDERLVVQLAIVYDQWAPGQHSAAVAALSEQSLHLRSSDLGITSRLRPAHALTSIRDRIQLTDDVPSITEQRWLMISDQWLDALNGEISLLTRRIVNDVSQEADAAARSRQRTIGLVIGSIAAGILLALFLSIRLVRRLLRITGVAERMAGDAGFDEEGSGVGLNDGGSDEIGRLSRSFDTMTDRLRVAALRQREQSQVLEMIVRREPLDEILTSSARLLGVDRSGEPTYRFVRTTSDDAVSGQDPPSRLKIVMAATGEDAGAIPASAGVAIGLAEMAERRAADDAEMAYAATRDTLTDLFNRRSVLDYAGRLLDQNESAAGEVQSGLLYIDLDGFKAINDDHGHGAGDAALVCQAERMATFARNWGGSAGRIGGDEFLVVLDQMQNEGDLAEVAADLAAVLQRPIHLGDTLTVTGGASIGASLLRPRIRLDEALHEADNALYASKVDGCSLPVVSTEQFRREVAERENLAAAFRLGLERREFFLWYQPIWSKGGVEVVGLEALARWNRPDVGVVFPDTFLPVAESLNLVAELDASLFSRVCKQIVQWEREGYVVPPINVNIAPPRLESDDFVTSTLDTLAEYDCSPELITLEVTEQLFMQQMEENCSRLAELRESGIRVAVDDFGQGYSSLAYLQHLPVDVLKIDREFIDNIDSSDTKVAIVSAVTELAGAMKLDVVAEGVEREEELACLEEIGCAMVQGYLLARPMPAEKLVDFLVRQADQTETPAETSEKIITGLAASDAGAAEWFDQDIPDRVPDALTRDVFGEAIRIDAVPVEEV